MQIQCAHTMYRYEDVTVPKTHHELYKYHKIKLYLYDHIPLGVAVVAVVNYTKITWWMEASINLKNEFLYCKLFCLKYHSCKILNLNQVYEKKSGTIEKLRTIPVSFSWRDKDSALVKQRNSKNLRWRSNIFSWLFLKNILCTIIQHLKFQNDWMQYIKFFCFMKLLFLPWN